MTRINVMKPWFGPQEAAAVTAVLESGWVAQGPRVAEFEREFARRQQVAEAVATSSCTAALHLALVVSGVQARDDVVVPSFSFVATANAPTYVGARPVFAEVDPLTGNVDRSTVAAALTPATRAVIVVDQGGVPVDLDPIRELCDPLGITVIEDAACAVGSTYRGRPVGAGAALATWSFHPRKLLTTGEGGMLTTDDQAWAARARRLREHAMSVSAATRHESVLAPPETYDEVGFNYRMTDLQAAIGLVQLGRLDAVVARRRALAQRYRAGLAAVRGLRLVADPTWGEGNFQSLWVEVTELFPLDRDGLLRHLAERGISGRRGIMAAHRQPAHEGRQSRTSLRPHLPFTERLTDRTLVLPLYHELTEDEVDTVLHAIYEAAGLARGETDSHSDAKEATA